MTGPDTNGLYRVEMKVYPGSVIQYKYVVAINGTDTQWEPSFSTSSGNREFTVPMSTDTIYLPNNWADTPPKPTGVTTSIVGIGEVKVSWAISAPAGLDVTYGGGYHLYSRVGAAGPPWTRVDTERIRTTSYTLKGLTMDTAYYFVVTAVDAYDSPGDIPSDSPAPPGPLMDTSSSVTDTPQGAIIVQFIIDMRKEIALAGRPPYGMAVAGSKSPLTWTPSNHPLREIQTGVWSDTFVMQGGQTLEYKYVKNPGTGKVEWEGTGDAATFLFRFDPASWGLSASDVSKVYVRGIDNNWGDVESCKLTKDDDGVFRLAKSITGTQSYKYYVYHTGAPSGDYAPGGSNLSVTMSGIPSTFTYGPDTTAVAVYIDGNFDPWSANQWVGTSKVNEFYSLTKDNRMYWRATRSMPTSGTAYEYKFVIDYTNDAVKNPTNWYPSSNLSLSVTGNRVAALAANYGSSTMRLVDVWEQAGYAPPRTPISVTAISADTTVSISWKASRDFVVNSYRIYRDTSMTGSFPCIATVAASAYPGYSDTGLTNGTTYYYKITAYDTGSLLESPYSDTQTGIPSAGPSKMARRPAVGQDTSVTIVFPGGTLTEGSFVQISSLLDMFDEKSEDSEVSLILSKIEAANEKLKTDPLQWAVSENSASDSDPLIYMIKAGSRATGSAASFADTAVTVSIPFQTAHQSFVGSMLSAGMSLYVLNESTQKWERVTGSATVSGGSGAGAYSVSAPRYAFSVFQVMAVAGAANNLNSLVSYPNPCYPNREFAYRGDPFGDGRPGITFINVPTDVEYIKIYTITGELVRSLDKTDGTEYSEAGGAAKMLWDLKNDGGRSVASAVYIFFAKSATSTRKGKVAVIR